MLRFSTAVEKTRFVLIHFHILKNAGTTFEHVLEREFSDQFVTLHGESSGDVIDGRLLTQLLADQPQLAAVSSHHLRYPMPEIPGTVLFDTCFLRHPLSRLQSVYSWFRRTQSTDRLCLKARQYSSGDFMRFLLSDMPNMACDVQVTQLARNGAFTRPANPRDLAIAIQRIQDMAMPGLLEMFDESMVCAEHFMNPAFPGLSLEYSIRNASPVGTPSTPARLRELWGDSLYERLCEANTYDLALIRATAAEISGRLRLVPDAENRLCQFRARCSELVAARAV